MAELAAARRSGGRVIMRLAGSHTLYQNKDHSFSLDKWKARVDRYRRFDFSSYIEDGTLVAHYILDEPHDASNWGGTLVPREAVDEMAKYSKQLWPKLATVVRGWPAYLKGYNYKYLDMAWAQYSERFGPIEPFIKENVRDAKASGLGLVVGLNALNGGTKSSGIKGRATGKFSMSASQIRSWGEVLLADPYPCAFIAWEYDEGYLARSDIASAFSALSQKARAHPEIACRRP